MGRIQSFGGTGPDGVDDLVPPPIVEADIALTGLKLRGGLLRLVAERPQLRGQRREVPEEFQPDAVLLGVPDDLIQVLLQQTHNGVHFLLGPLPVLGGKGVDRQIFDADLLAVVADLAEGLRPGGVAHGAGHAPLLGPPAVAVHDDGNVGGDAAEINLRYLLSTKDSHTNISCLNIKASGGTLRCSALPFLTAAIWGRRMPGSVLPIRAYLCPEMTGTLRRSSVPFPFRRSVRPAS